MARDDSSLPNVFENLMGNKNIQAEKERIEKEKESDDSKVLNHVPTKSHVDENVSNEQNNSVKEPPKKVVLEDSSIEVTSNIPTPNEIESLSTESHEDSVENTSNEVIEPLEDVELDTEDATNPFGETLINKFNEKKRKPTIEESHTRNTLFIRNDLHKRMTRLTKNRRGLKTMLVNEAIEAVLDAVEGNKK